MASGKDTVRKRTGSGTTSTQRFLPVAEVRQNAMLLKSGGLRAVLEVEALNYNLKSETEQQAIIAGYGAFLNSLDFPVQILVRSRKTNIDAYLQQVRTIGEAQQNALLKKQTMAYASFVQKLVEVADIMQKKFYVVIPVDHNVRHKTLIEQFFDWMSPDDNATKATTRRSELGRKGTLLSERVELVSSALGNIGLHVRRLNTRELIVLLYETYNPKTSQLQKIPQDEHQLNVEENVI